LVFGCLLKAVRHLKKETTMSLTMKEKEALTRETREEYKKASKKQKAEILEKFNIRWATASSYRRLCRGL
jgi:predicted GIY-YIG superfamily endonuclease